MNVLIIVDVQNCFMYNSDKNRTFLNVEKDDVSNEIISELEILAKKSDVVVLSRDFHPLNHISIEGSEGRVVAPPNVWPAHCRNRRIKCKSRLQETTVGVESDQQEASKNHIVNTETGELFEYGTEQWTANKSKPNFIYVIGTDLSHAFFKSSLFKDPVKQLVVANKTGRYKIGLTTTRMEYVDDNYKLQTIDAAEQGIPDTSNAPLTVDGKKYIALTKGERCNDEAFSAFNYHINYDPANAAQPEAVPIPPTDKSNSTGLWEWILLNRGANTEITITVCGLVGNVCVMHSLLQGIALWNNIYSKDSANAAIKVKFVYSLCGTRFTKDLAPKEVKPIIGVDFRSEIVDWFNLNKPSGLGEITVKKLVDAAGCVPEHAINNFEILNYYGTPKFIGAFSLPASDDTGAASGGTRRRRRRKHKSKSKVRKMNKRASRTRRKTYRTRK